MDQNRIRKVVPQSQYIIQESNQLHKTARRRNRILEKDGEFYLVDFSRGFLDFILGLDIFLSKKAYPMDISKIPNSLLVNESDKSSKYRESFALRFYFSIPLRFYWLIYFFSGYCNLAQAIWVSLSIALFTSIKVLIHISRMKECKEVVSNAKFVDFDNYVYMTAILGRSRVSANIRKINNYVFLIFP